MNRIREIYKLFIKTYGLQGWWPLSTVKENNGYHNGDYILPETTSEKFEIITGAVLTQNTAWKNVRTAIENLNENKLMDPEKISAVKQDRLALIIRPSGYFNQKAKKLKAVSGFILDGGYLNGKIPQREELLNVWGIGPETADSILLYAYKVPVFVVDAYTKRILSRMGITARTASYESIQKIFSDEYSGLNKAGKLIVFNEYHALIVRHAKEFCRKNPACRGCPVSECKKLY
jgi:endonuclease-3 related protein